MNRLGILLLSVAVLLFAAVPGDAEVVPSTMPTPAYIAEVHPGLATEVLSYAMVAELPEGVLVESETVRVTEADLAEAIAKAPEALRAQLKANTFFLAEQVAARPLVQAAARRYIAEGAIALADQSEAALLGAYQQRVARSVTVTDADVAAFYEANREMCGGATLDQIKDQLAAYVRQQKQVEAVRNQVRTLGKQIPIRVAAGWAAQQAQVAKDNAVDRARGTGRPTMVDFGADGCRACDLMAPILELLKTKYGGRANAMFVNVRNDPVLAARYGIDGIPVQVFFDASGTEVFRHSGYYPRAEIEKRLQALGVK